MVSSGAAGLAAAGAGVSTKAGAEPAPRPDSKTPGLFKLGDQTAPTNDVHLKYLARYGVRNICGYPQIEGGRLYATVDELKRMKDLALASRVKADLVLDPKTSELELDVRASNGEVTISGKIPLLSEVDEIERVVRSTPGVTVLHLDELVSSTRD